jgi:hypothetical protein
MIEQLQVHVGLLSQILTSRVENQSLVYQVIIIIQGHVVLVPQEIIVKQEKPQ